MSVYYALVDCNNFYASCERVFNPALKRRPVVVLSNNDGCCIARSSEAKALGIPMGAPLHQWKAVIRKHRVAVFSSNYVLYGDMSNRVMNLLAQCAARIEIYSIDEAFLEIHGVDRETLQAWAADIHARVFQATGIPVSIGVGESKTLAKAANRLAKQLPDCNGVLNLVGHPQKETLLAQLEVRKVWGTGPQYQRKLERRRIFTALDLMRVEPEWARQEMTVCGMRTVYELRGISCIPIESIPPPKKSIGCSRSFGQPVTRHPLLREALSHYVERAAEKLREERLAAGAIQVYITTNPFLENAPQYANAKAVSLPEATNYTPILNQAATALLKQLYKPGFVYKKVGVLFFGLVPENVVQQDIFHSDPHAERHSRLMHSLDRINQRWGSGTLLFAASGLCRQWKMQRAYLSRRYTTNWTELLTVKAC